jgi:hypothetical protein
MTKKSCGKPSKEIKVWPKLGVSSWLANAGGAWRIWRLAKHYDPTNSGRVDREGFYEYLNSLGVPRQNRWRWLNKALELGLITQVKYPWGIVFQTVGVARGASILGCEQLGYPVFISVADLIKTGWRATVWVALHAWLDGPISQATKERLTGVNPRTQRNYLSEVQHEKQKNYTERDLDPEYLPIHKEVLPDRHLFLNEQGQVIQRLPDKISVPDQVARKAPKGRSRKAQRELNATSSKVRREQCGQPVRMFYKDPGVALKTLRAAAVPASKAVPGHLFLEERKENNVTWHDALPMVESGEVCVE